MPPKNLKKISSGYLLPPPWVRPGWDSLNKPMQAYSLTAYNQARVNKGLQPLDMRWHQTSQFPAGFSALNINPNLPHMGAAFKAAQDLYRRTHPSQPDPEHWRTTQTPHVGPDVDLDNRHFNSDAADVMNSSDEQLGEPFEGIVEATNDAQIHAFNPDGDLNSEFDKFVRDRHAASTPKRPSPPKATANDPDLIELDHDSLSFGSLNSGSEFEHSIPRRVPETQGEAPPTGKKNLPEPLQPTPATALPTVPAATQAPSAAPTANMPQPGTGQNTSAPSVGGGETGPNSFSISANSHIGGSVSYSKMYKFSLIGNGPTILEETLTSPVDHVNDVLITNLREIPVHCLASYLTPGEYAYLSSLPNIQAKRVRVKIGKKSTQASFSTNQTTSGEAVLNYNKTYKVAIGLNLERYFGSRFINKYSSTNVGTPETVADPIDMTTIMKTAWNTSVTGSYPAFITRSTLKLPNVFCQIKPDGYGYGWADHSKKVKEYDDDNVPIVIYDHTFGYAPIHKPVEEDLLFNNYFTVGTATDAKGAHTYLQSKRARTGDKMLVTTQAKDKTPRGEPKILEVVKTDMNSLKPVWNKTFTIDDVIEKGPFCSTFGNDLPMGKKQPSLHIGIGEVNQLSPFISPGTGLYTELTSNKFVPQLGEIWATFEIELSWHNQGLYRVNQTTPYTSPENQVLTYWGGNGWPKSADIMKNSGNAFLGMNEVDPSLV